MQYICLVTDSELPLCNILVFSQMLSCFCGNPTTFILKATVMVETSLHNFIYGDRRKSYWSLLYVDVLTPPIPD